jgi:hypothetical protein|tara:strand:- start:232 stop:582 length:351 start_codon:yes stop_codon:yes gene_type:complete
VEIDQYDIDYAVVDGQDVLLSVTTGNSQIGGTAVLLDGSLKSSGENIINLNLGQGAGLRDSFLRVKTTVTDYNNQTNNLVVKHELDGGPNPHSEVRTLTVENQGDAGIFTFIVQFI